MVWVAIAAGLGLSGCSKSNQPAAAAAEKSPAKGAKEETKLVELDASGVKEARLVVAPVTLRSVPLTVRANGRLSTNENASWRVGAVTEGRIVEVAAKVGDRVQMGQVLARMHSHDIHESRAEYRKAVSDYNRLQATSDFARRTRDRMRRLYEMKAASLEQVDQAENEWKTAQASLSNAAIEVARTKNHLVEFLEVSIDGPEEHDHDAGPEHHPEDLIPIRAPASGIVLTRSITPGAVVGASNDLFLICDLSTIWAMAAVQEEHLAQLRTGMLARVSVQAYPNRRFLGRVAKIDEKLDPETRTVSVRIEIDNRAGLLKPEMYSTVEIEAGGSESALFAPQSAVQDVNGQSMVFVEKSSGKYEPRPVETGQTLEGLIQILRGLKDGERVVSEGSFILKSQMLKASLSEE
jgi:cobalt-zinc-cadmium efflux system membrane fusion protein